MTRVGSARLDYDVTIMLILIQAKGMNMDDDLKDEQELDGSQTSGKDEETVPGTADATLNTTEPGSVSASPRSQKRMRLGLLLLLVIGVGAFLIFSLSDDTPITNVEDISTEDDTENTQGSDSEEEKKVFDQIVYAHSGSDSSSRELYTRSASGGDRTPLDFNFGINTFLSVDQNDDAYVVGTRDGKVYYSSGVETPKLIYTAEDDIAGLKLDASAGSVVVLERDESNFKAIPSLVTKVMLDGSGSEVFFSELDATENGALFLEHWNGDDGVLYARRSCTNCDGYNPNLIKIDDEGAESAVFEPGESFSSSSGYVFNNDNSKALFVKSTVYTLAQQEALGIASGLGGPNAAPFTLVELDLASGSTTNVVTFGESKDVNADGFYDAPAVAWANGTEGQRRAYSYQKKLFVQNQGGAFDNYFETRQGVIRSIYSIDDDELLVGASNQEGDTISYYNIETQKGAIVMETLFTTNILGVTLK